MTPLDPTAFPPGFLWGTATASYQIEGAVAEGGRRPSHWDVFAHTPGKTLHGDTGDVACDHYHRTAQDVALMKDLGLNAYRFSLAWPRLQPGGAGDLNPQGVAFYRGLLEELLAAGIHPMVTLYHWDLPQVLAEAGGWPARETIDRYVDYAHRVAGALGDLVTDWITLNEPWCQAFLGHALGEHAPGHSSIPEAIAAAHHQNVAHGLAVEAVKAASPTARVGVTHILTDIHPASDAEADVLAAERYDLMANRIFLDPLFGRGYPAEIHALGSVLPGVDLEALVRDGDLEVAARVGDFLGVNHYHQYFVRHDDAGPLLWASAEYAPGVARTAFDWGVTPSGLAGVLRRVREDYGEVPLYVTENGASFHDYVDPTGRVRDIERIEYLAGYLGACAQVIAEGVDLRGYFCWSLMDNFEWATGYSQRFGLVWVDYGTQARIPKDSAAWYRDVIAAHRAARAAG